MVVEQRHILITSPSNKSWTEHLPLIGGKIARKKAIQMWEKAYGKAYTLGQIGEHFESRDEGGLTSITHSSSPKYDFTTTWNTSFSLREKFIALHIEAENEEDKASVNLLYKSPDHNFNSGIWFDINYGQVYLPTNYARTVLAEYLSSNYEDAKTKDTKTRIERNSNHLVPTSKHFDAPIRLPFKPRITV